MRVALGSDHARFRLKQALAVFLDSLSYEVLDVGTHSTEPVDYPNYAVAVGLAILDGVMRFEERSKSTSSSGKREELQYLVIFPKYWERIEESDRGCNLPISGSALPLSTI